MEPEPRYKRHAQPAFSYHILDKGQTPTDTSAFDSDRWIEELLHLIRYTWLAEPDE